MKRPLQSPSSPSSGPAMANHSSPAVSAGTATGGASPQFTTTLKMELGHYCTLKEHIREGYRVKDREATHDWEFFVRDKENDRMAYVEKMVVHLHETFPNPTRTLYKPPFKIKESGYAGFQIYVDLHFKGLPAGDPAKTVITQFNFLVGRYCSPEQKCNFNHRLNLPCATDAAFKCYDAMYRCFPPTG